MPCHCKVPRFCATVGFATPMASTITLQDLFFNLAATPESAWLLLFEPVSLRRRHQTHKTTLSTTTRSVTPPLPIAVLDHADSAAAITHLCLLLPRQSKQSDRCRVALTGCRCLPGVCTRCVVLCIERQQKQQQQNSASAGDGAAAVVLQLLPSAAVRPCRQHSVQTQGMQMHTACS